ncbi:MAG TPA: choice-of-anchor Q domain-containing protein, partial [Pyrinomonadaceae bacterium]|nr:choice-of-anchor Q domain-containing protein [Pyrinomonadaceae bacterium]
ATINQAGAQPDPATVQPVNFTAAFSEPVYNLTASGVSFSGSTADLSAANVSVSGGLTNYAISVENIKTIGRILAFIPASGATDAAGNSNTAATFTDRQVSYVGNGEVVVTKTTEGGNCTAADCSLRAALNLIQDTASPASNFNVNFNIPANDTNCTAGVCTIPTSGELIVAARVAINGSGAKTLILNAGNNTSRAFYVNNSAVAAIKNLTITGGNPISGLDSSYNNNGGAILNFGSLTLDGVEVKNNRANLYNGAIGSYGNLTILNSTISNNLCSGATGSTGGIGASGTLTIVNSTISGNRIPSGTEGSAGGVWTDAQTLIVNSTVTDNETGAGGDRAGGFRHANGTSKIRNTIIAGNRSNADTPDVMGAPVSLGNNFIGNRGAVTTFNQSSDKTGTTVSVLNPLLAALGSYGGATQTHALLSNSTARDAGNDCVLIQMCGSDNVAFNLTTDQRGSLAPRKIGTSVDIGAFESNVSFSTSATGVSGQGTLPNGQINRSYSVIFAASRQNSLIEFAGDGNQTPESFTAFTYSVASGSLPPGLTLNPNTGELSGTPTQTGNFAFTILATDADGTAGAQSYNLLIMSPTAAAVSVGGRVLTSGGRGIAGAAVTITDATGNTRTTHTNFFGYYSFQDVAVGETYIFSVKAKRVFFSQPIQIRSVFEEIGDLNFIGDSPQTINFTDEIANLNFYGK